MLYCVKPPHPHPGLCTHTQTHTKLYLRMYQLCLKHINADINVFTPLPHTYIHFYWYGCQSKSYTLLLLHTHIHTLLAATLCIYVPHLHTILTVQLLEKVPVSSWFVFLYVNDHAKHNLMRFFSICLLDNRGEVLPLQITLFQ